MFKRILVPLDGSPRAERAIPVAARLAGSAGGKVTLLRVADLPTAFVPYSSADPWTTQKIIDADAAEAKEYLEGVTCLDSLRGVQIETEVIVGTAAATILSVAESRHFDLLVLCSHGRSGMKRWLLGSVAEHVARYAPVSILLLREGGPALIGVPPQAEGPLCALIPLDSSARAEAAMLPAARLIAALAAPGPASLHLTRVVAQLEPTESGKREWEEQMCAARQYLSATAAHLREALEEAALSTNRFAITWSIICDDDIAAGILRVAETGEATEAADGLEQADVIAIATHGYSGIQCWAMGSITERVLHACRLPMLVVRPAEMIDQQPKTQE
jgi:nucleotide-binding universal stress UspA family protein